MLTQPNNFSHKPQSDESFPALDNVKSLHNCGFESVRTIISRNRPWRGVLPLYLYDSHENDGNSNKQAEGGHHVNASTATAHTKLSKFTIKPLGETQRQAQVLADNEKRILCKNHAKDNVTNFFSR